MSKNAVEHDMTDITGREIKDGDRVVYGIRDGNFGTIKLGTVEELLAFSGQVKIRHTGGVQYKPCKVVAVVAGDMSAPPRELVEKLWGALNFILAFYEPGQKHLDTEAWKVAESGGIAARKAAREWLDGDKQDAE